MLGIGGRNVQGLGGETTRLQKGGETSRGAKRPGGETTRIHVENGASVILQFDSLDDVMLFIFDQYSGHSYELTPIVLSLNLDVPNRINNEHNILNTLLGQTSTLTNNPTEVPCTAANDFTDSDNEQYTATPLFNVTCSSVDDQTEMIWTTANNYVELSSHDHTCFGGKSKPKRKVQKRVRKKAKEMSNIEICEISGVELVETTLYDDILLDDPSSLDIGFVCEIQTSEESSGTQFTDYANSDDHDSVYENEIRKKASHLCSCCHRFLFENQVYHLARVSDVCRRL